MSCINLRRVCEGGGVLMYIMYMYYTWYMAITPKEPQGINPELKTNNECHRLISSSHHRVISKIPPT